MTSSSVAPDAPTGLELHLTASGIVALWQAPEGSGLTYNLYRSDQLEITEIGDLQPVVAKNLDIHNLSEVPAIRAWFREAGAGVKTFGVRLGVDSLNSGYRPAS